MSLTRSVSGLIHQDSFASLASWIGGTHWTVDSTQPFFICWPSAITLMPSTDTYLGGVREVIVQFVAANDTVRWMKHDTGDGSHPWYNSQDTTNDGGQSWAKGGNNAFTHGSHDGIVCGAPDVLYGGVYYKYPGYSDSHGGNVNSAPYVSQVYTASTLDSTSGVSWVADAPPLGTSGTFNDYVNLFGHVIVNQLDGSAVAYFSCVKFAGTLFSIGRATATNPSMAGVSEAQLVTAAGVGTTFSYENPKYVAWTSSMPAALICNAISSDGAGYSVSNDAFFADSENNWDDASMYRVRMQYEGLDSSKAIGMLTPFLNEYGLAAMEADESFGYSYDGNSTDVITPYHEFRDALQGQAEPSVQAAKYTAPIPGTIGGVDFLMWNAAHTSVIIQFVVEWLDTTNDTTGNLFELLWRMTSADTAGDGYVLNAWAGGANDLFKYVGGTPPPPAIPESGTRTRRLPVDAKNLQYERWRLEAVGNNHKLFIEDETVINYTDGGTPNTSGSYFGFSGAGNVCRFRAFAAYKAKAVTVSGCGASAVVSLCGASGAIFDQQTADGSGNVTLTSDHYPMYSLLVNGTRHKLAANATIWGGDTVAVGSDVPTITPDASTTLLNTTPTITFTGSATSWLSVSPSSILSATGSATFDTFNVISNTSMQAVLRTGAGTAFTVTDNTTGATAAFTIGAATLYYATGPTRGAVNIAKTITLYANGTTTATITGHTTGTGTFASTVALNGTAPVTLSYTPTDFSDSPHTLSFTDSASLTDPANIVLTVTEFPEGSTAAVLIAIGVI